MDDINSYCNVISRNKLYKSLHDMTISIIIEVRSELIDVKDGQQFLQMDNEWINELLKSYVLINSFVCVFFTLPSVTLHCCFCYFLTYNMHIVICANKGYFHFIVRNKPSTQKYKDKL